MKAIGGMRNPQLAVERNTNYKLPGLKVRQLLRKAQLVWPCLCEPATAILKHESPSDFPLPVLQELRRLTLEVLGGSNAERRRTARASTPIQANVVEAWGLATGDIDTDHLVAWLDHGAPLGFVEEIPSVGVFPTVDGPEWSEEQALSTFRTIGWQNYQSAEAEKEDLCKLIEDYTARGFCHMVKTMEEAEEELGRKPHLNKLGVVVKFNEQGVKKSRIIWDLKESGANAQCNQGERIILPRLLDLASGALKAFRMGKEAWVVAIDIKDAFMNIPSGADKFMTVAVAPDLHGKDQQLVVFDTLVFGSGSSPTLWGRYAAWLGRSMAAIEPDATIQVYVDDPAIILTGDLKEASQTFTTLLLWLAITGFPIKLTKATGGKQITWIGAALLINDDEKSVTVTIPQSKVEKLQKITDSFIAKPVVGRRQLRSYAGMLSFVAGLVPHLRPFLSALWLVLGCGPTHDGAGNTLHSGKLIHTRRIKHSLLWVKALLGGEPGPLQRVLRIEYPKREIVTDACPMGGVLRVDSSLSSYFATPLPDHLLTRFKAQRGDPKYNTLWEGLALLVALRLWLPELGRSSSVRTKSDNMGALFMLAKGKAKSQDLNKLAREYALDQALELYRLTWLDHIPGLTNLEADALSRLFCPKPAVMPAHLKDVVKSSVDLGANFWKVGRLEAKQRC